MKKVKAIILLPLAIILLFCSCQQQQNKDVAYDDRYLPGSSLWINGQYQRHLADIERNAKLETDLVLIRYASLHPPVTREEPRWLQPIGATPNGGIWLKPPGHGRLLFF